VRRRGPSPFSPTRRRSEGPGGGACAPRCRVRVLTVEHVRLEEDLRAHAGILAWEHEGEAQDRAGVRAWRQRPFGEPSFVTEGRRAGPPRCCDASSLLSHTCAACSPLTAVHEEDAGPAAEALDGGDDVDPSGTVAGCAEGCAGVSAATGARTTRCRAARRGWARCRGPRRAPSRLAGRAWRRSWGGGVVVGVRCPALDGDGEVAWQGWVEVEVKHGPLAAWILPHSEFGRVGQVRVGGKIGWQLFVHPTKTAAFS
jgi:hypothetical protein